MNVKKWTQHEMLRSIISKVSSFKRSGYEIFINIGDIS